MNKKFSVKKKGKYVSIDLYMTIDPEYKYPLFQSKSLKRDKFYFNKVDLDNIFSKYKNTMFSYSNMVFIVEQYYE